MIASYRRPPARPAAGVSERRAPSFAGSRQPLIRFIPAVFRQNESSCMPRQHRASAQIVGSLSRFIRHHVDIFPVLVILPVLHDRQIDRTELIAYRFKVRPIPAVAAVINLLLRGNEQKTGPQRLVTLQPTAEKCRAGGTWTVSSSLAGTACCQSASVISAPSIPQ